MKIDYKFWYIKRDDNGYIIEAAIRFYEGEITTKNEKNVNQEIVSVTRYRRNKRLQKDDIQYIKTEFKKESSGYDCAVYNQKHFGEIKTNDELKLFLNKEIANDTKRVAIDEQK